MRFKHISRLFKKIEKTYNSFESAQASCGFDYENDDIVNVVVEKTKIYRDSITKQHPFIADKSSLRTIVGLSLSRRSNKLNVIDFGGACGAHYFISKRILGERVKLRWHVVETTKMASEAILTEELVGDLGYPLEDGQLKFFDDLQKARAELKHVDLIFSSGALQCVRKPYQCLEALVGLNADYIYLTRIGLSNLEQDFIIVQKSNLSANGPGPMPKGIRDRSVKYPVTFARKEKFEAILNQKYAIDIIFNEDKGAYRAAKHPINMYGYFCSRKK